MDLIIIRLVFIAVVAVACYHLKPFGLANLPAWIAACVGIAIGLIVVWFEARLRVVSLKRLIGAVIGSILGILGAYLFGVVIKNSITHSETQRFLMLMVMLLMSTECHQLIWQVMLPEHTSCLFVTEIILE